MSRPVFDRDRDAHVVVYGERGYYSTGYICPVRGQLDTGGYFRLKADAVRHARALARERGVDLVIETNRTAADLAAALSDD